MPQRAAIYRSYLRNRRRVDNWDLVDASAEHIVGAHLRQADRNLLKRLARSDSLWDRRIAILRDISLHQSRRVPRDVAVARLLLNDPHDLIHKAVGWYGVAISLRRTFGRTHVRARPDAYNLGPDHQPRAPPLISR